ncbi:MAG: DNA-formamidopyrimidine glycosylase [Candidatus Lambdaproteobacteria bacterium RIFOXYC1_FULL_56_13]|nr:MAG: DNA-formamidopyrimidine glycosylase [Candidatus Lambdaproteobacteria bacterium RIFOXYC1_FULL_56_13]
MPELPEVETVRRGLLAEVLGQKVLQVKVHRASVVRGAPKALCRAIEGQTLEGIDRAAKYLLFRFGPHSLLAHLGMSGKFVVTKAQEPLKPHDRVVFTLSDQRRLVFSELRCFGFLELLDPNVQHPRLAKLGVDALTAAIEPKALQAAWSHTKRPLKTLLLDQSPLAGIGNIYAAEILFAAKLSPLLAGNKLRPTQALRLLEETRRILGLALEANGTSISDFRRVDDKTGGFQEFLQVYGKTDQPCRTCGREIKRIIQAGRSSFYCPHCQKL